jgi:nucleotide-binding universal stress UspA family protein
MGAIRSMLVHVDGSARLTALFATNPPLVDAAYAYAASAVSSSVLQDAYAQRLSRAKSALDVTRSARFGELAWAELHAEPSVVRGVSQQALFTDLLVLGQHDPTDASAQDLPADFVESVLIDSGKPALVVPYAGEAQDLRGTALVAWKPGPESARALAAALPLLQRCARVQVVHWGADTGPRLSGEVLDVQSYLALHGVEATLHHARHEPRDVGEALLSHACDLGAGLLVMGCYGRSRARELVLGGASRTILRSMTLPVLMCH